ncbi:MAG: hypothetical protein UR26_C0001G0001, partial [candidate division TM6 bacterium GW2011_GWF2_32_72]
RKLTNFNKTKNKLKLTNQINNKKLKKNNTPANHEQ